MLSNVLLYFGLFLSDSQADAHLKKLYERQAGRCEIVAKKLAKKHKSWASPIYYLMLASRQKMDEVQDSTLKVQYLNHTLMYASRYRKKTGSNSIQKLTYDSLMHSMKTEIPHWLSYLEEKKLYTKYAQIEEKASQLLYRNTYFTNALTGRTTVPTTTEPRHIRRPKKVVLKKIYVDFSIRSTAGPITLFRGLPTGQETIVPASREQALVVFKLVNQLRKEKGVKPVRWNEDLARSANYHAHDMIWDDYFNHDSMDRSSKGEATIGTFSDRVYRFYKKRSVGENIAAGYSSGEKVFWGWYHSKGHYENMIDPGFNEIGIGVAKFNKTMLSPVWVMNLGANY